MNNRNTSYSRFDKPKEIISDAAHKKLVLRITVEMRRVRKIAAGVPVENHERQLTLGRILNRATDAVQSNELAALTRAFIELSQTA